MIAPVKSQRLVSTLLTTLLMVALLPVSAPPADASDPVGDPDLEFLIDHGIILGDGAGLGLGKPLTRGQMATVVDRALEFAGSPLPAPTGDLFHDIEHSVHRDAINRAGAAGLLRGRSDGSFSPALHVRRDQFASFLVSAAAYALHADVSDLTSNEQVFEDVTEENPHFGSVNGAAREGLMRGITMTLYEPKASVRRDQMSSFVVRLLALILDDPIEPPPPPDPDPDVPPLVSVIVDVAGEPSGRVRIMVDGHELATCDKATGSEATCEAEVPEGSDVEIEAIPPQGIGDGLWVEDECEELPGDGCAEPEFEDCPEQTGYNTCAFTALHVTVVKIHMAWIALTIPTLVIDGQHFPMFQFVLAPPEESDTPGHGCPEDHWHSHHEFVASLPTLSQLTDPAPHSCGFGMYSEVPQGRVLPSTWHLGLFFDLIGVPNPF